MLFYILYSPVPPPFSSALALLCTRSLLHTSMQLLYLHVQLFPHSLQSKAYTRNQRYLTPNSDYENNISIFSVSSGIPTTFLPVLLSHTMGLILRLDLIFTQDNCIPFKTKFRSPNNVLKSILTIPYFLLIYFQAFNDKSCFLISLCKWV